MDRPVEKRLRHIDRIKLTPDSLSKVNAWLAQIDSKGVRVNRADLINWVIKSQSDKLSTSQVKEIEELFFDQVKHLKWMLTQVAEAQARGERLIVKIVEGKTESAASKRLRTPKDKTAVSKSVKEMRDGEPLPEAT